MHRKQIYLFLSMIVLVGLGCSTIGRIADFAAPLSSPVPPTLAFSPTLVDTALPTRTPHPTKTDLPAPSATHEPTPTYSPTLVQSDGFDVRFHPDGGLYVGDRVSFEVIAPAGQELNETLVHISSTGSITTELAVAGFANYGIGGRRQATVYWGWDTTGLPPGEYALRFSLDPTDLVFTRTVTLLPEDDLPFPGRSAEWASMETACCVIHYVTGTAAERDLPELAVMVDEQAEKAIDRMGLEFAEPIAITFLPRLLGHGGFASGEIFVSYLDRSATAMDVSQVIHHEMIHILDQRLGGDYRPSFFVEGLATYMSQGHYKPEPIYDRAVSAYDQGLYLLLRPLADNFYPSQHELSYLHAAAVIDFIIQRWGYPAFDTFYRTMQRLPEPSGQADVIDAALRQNFGLGLDELEQAFISELVNSPVNPDVSEDVALTAQYFDLLRWYQQLYDPSAYYLTAWLPPGQTMREEGIVDDFLRHPNAPENIALELMLANIGSSQRQGKFEEAWAMVGAVKMVLQASAAGDAQPFAVHPLAEDTLSVTLQVLAMGYEPQVLVLDEGTARIQATRSGMELEALLLEIK